MGDGSRRAALAVTAVFVYGTLRDDRLRGVVLGGPVTGAPGFVAGAVCATGFAATLVGDEGRAEGLLLDGLAPDARARLDRYAALSGQTARHCAVQTAGGAVAAVLYAGGAPEGAWSLAGWQAQLGDAAVLAVAELLDLPANGAGGWRYGSALSRAASRLRAGQTGARQVRRAQAAGDVTVARLARPYGAFFAVEEADLAFRRFDGGMSETVTRAAFVMADAVTVLPYDPVRDRVLLVEQFRAGPFLRGDAECWSLEAIAGRIDPGETPEEAARREAVEEAGLVLGAMEFVAGYYPSPGAVTEYLYSYVALADLPDGVAGVFGVEGEAEDIRGHLLDFERLMALVAGGEVNNAPLVLTALWLQRERARLRA